MDKVFMFSIQPFGTVQFKKFLLRSLLSKTSWTRTGLTYSLFLQQRGKKVYKKKKKNLINSTFNGTWSTVFFGSWQLRWKPDRRSATLHKPVDTEWSGQTRTSRLDKTDFSQWLSLLITPALVSLMLWRVCLSFQLWRSQKAYTRNCILQDAWN